MGASGILAGLSLLAGTTLGLLAVLIIIPVVIVLDWASGRLRISSIILAVVCIGLGTIRASTSGPAMPIADLADSGAAIGVVARMPVSGGDFERANVRVESLQLLDESWLDVTGEVLVYLPRLDRPVNVGDRVFLIWSATPVQNLSPGYRGFVASQGAAGSAHAWSVRIESRAHTWTSMFAEARRGIIQSLTDVIPGDAGALAAGIVTGDNSGLSKDTEDAFRRTGTTHITAVSGQNVALLTGFIAMWFPPRRRWIRVVSHATMFLAVWLYVGMVGLEPSALRSAIVASLMIVGGWFGRRPDPLTILAMTLGAMALLDPRMVANVGFWLSAAASWALCGSLGPRSEPGIVGAMTGVIGAVMAANIATLPIIVWAFGEWSPVGLLANVLLGPVMTLTFPATYALVLVGAIVPWVVPFVAWIPAIGLDIGLAIVNRLSIVLPTIQIPVSGPGMALLIAIPCFGGLALVGRDGERWRQRAVLMKNRLV